jgi:uncharacterized MAPEG superfamily protein
MSVTASQSPELFWLAAVTTLTAVLWVPYVLNRILENGLWAPLRRAPAEIPQRALWAIRMAAAHQNAVENLVIFAAFVLVAVVAHRTNAMTAQAAMVYFIARVVHFIVYTAGIPVLRTLAFAAGWIACLTIALAIFGF